MSRWLLIIIVIALAVFFRLWHLASIPPGLFPDEAMNGNNASEALATGNFKIFYVENNGREGLFINLQALSIKMFGNTPFALRFMAALFGILSVIALYFFVRAYTGSNLAAFLAAFFMATSFWHIVLSRLGFRANMAPFFLTAGLALIYSAWRREAGRAHAKTLLISALGGILFGLGFHSYIAYRIAPILLIFPLAIFIDKARKNPDRCLLCIPAIFIFFAVLAGVPLGLYFLEHPSDFFGRTSQISIFSEGHILRDFLINTGKTIGMFFFAGDFNWRHNFAGAPALWWPVALLFLVGIAETIRKKYFLLMVWLIFMMSPVLISSEGIPHALRSIILIPAVFAIVGVGTESALKLLPKRVAIIGFFILALLIIWNSYNFYFQKWARRPEVAQAFATELYDIGLYINTLPDDVQKYVITDEVQTIDVTGAPMALEPILFVTKTYLPEPKGARNIFYMTPAEFSKVSCQANCVIIPLGNRERVIELIKDSAGFVRLESRGSTIIIVP